MTVAGLAIDATNRSPIILLRDPSGRRQVPIWVDNAQAHNIMAGFQQSDSKRPLSHDLMVSLLKAGNLHLERVIIHSIERDTFQAILKIRIDNSKDTDSKSDLSSFLEIHALPSDAIALAIRSKCTIWMLEKVFAETSIPVDEEADAADQDKFRRFLDDVSPSDLVRHLKESDQNNETSTDFP